MIVRATNPGKPLYSQAEYNEILYPVGGTSGFRSIAQNLGTAGGVPWYTHPCRGTSQRAPLLVLDSGIHLIPEGVAEAVIAVGRGAQAAVVGGGGEGPVAKGQANGAGTCDEKKHESSETAACSRTREGQTP